MNIFEAAGNLKLPKGSYAVFGSGPMAARGLRDTLDVDLIVTEGLYKQLKDEGWEEKQWDDGGVSLSKNDVEVFKTWNFGMYQPDPNDLIANAEMIDGVPFVKLTEVLKWKLAFGREKDLKDAKILQNYLNID